MGHKRSKWKDKTSCIYLKAGLCLAEAREGGRGRCAHLELSNGRKCELCMLTGLKAGLAEGV